MANVNVRMDSEIKHHAEEIFDKMGLTPTVAIGLFYRQVILNNGIPFMIRADIPNEATLRAIREAEDMERHPERYNTYDDVDELFEDLEKWFIKSKLQVNSNEITNYV